MVGQQILNSITGVLEDKQGVSPLSISEQKQDNTLLYIALAFGGVFFLGVMYLIISKK